MVNDGVIRLRNKGIRRVRVADLEDAPWNFRTHPAEQEKALAGAIEELGFYGYPDVYETDSGTLRICDGHLRKELLIKQYGVDAEIDVNITDFDEAEAKKATLTKDPLAAMAESDPEKLDELLREVETGSESLQAMLADLAKDAGLYLDTPEIVEDEVPELPDDPITKPGDLWLLGEHRLLCGDSTKLEDVARLMDGRKASCVFTDPPYGVSIGAKNRFLNTLQPSGRCLENIDSDDMTPESLKLMLLPAFVLLRTAVMSDDCTLFVTAPQGGELGMMMMMMMQDAGLRARHVLIWKKNQPTFSMGRLDYDYAHEPILLTWGKRHKRPMLGKHRTSVWEIDRERKCDVHPTMKPVELYANAYLNNSDEKDIVADIYSGSGTAFIASEQLGRRCYGMEVSPQYVDVCVARWGKFTGRKAEILTPAAAKA